MKMRIGGSGRRSGQMFTGLFILVVLVVTSTVRGASRDDVATLKLVAAELEIPSTMWDFSGNADPCAARWPGVGCCSGLSTRCCTSASDIYYNLPITLNACDFSSDSNVTVLMLRSDITKTVLNGTLSSAFCNLRSLLSLDVEFNNLRGQIPSCLKNMTLQVLRLGSNLINGTIPVDLGDGSLGASLVELHLDSLQLTGEIPASLSKLTAITSIVLANNQLQGNIPVELVNILKLHVLHFQGNRLTGGIPAFGSQLTELNLFGNSLSGELNATSLKAMTGCLTLDVRHNAFSGSIPELRLSALVTLDLGFNSFTGRLPSLEGMSNLRNLFLGHNFLTGDLVQQSRQVVDLSHNQLVLSPNQSTTSLLDPSRQVNYAFNSFGNSFLGVGVGAQELYFATNAGGQQVVRGGLTYDNDTNTVGNLASNLTNSSVGFFYVTGRSWALELSGTSAGTYTQQVPIVDDADDDVELYQSMRWTSSYLAYHGIGLKPGKYKVTLYFAELIFSEPEYRQFDVLVASRLVKQGLDVVKEAGGPRRGYKLVTDAMVPENGTLSVELVFSSGKERTLPPNTYALDNVGPMISAISVVSEEHVPRSGGKQQVAAKVVGIVIAVLVAFVVAGAVYWRFKKRTKLEPPGSFPRLPDFESLDSSQMSTSSFSFGELHRATNGFTEKLGEGGFGAVYKGTLADGVVIAVKQLLLKKKNDNERAMEDFKKEMFIVSKLRHRNLLSVLGHSLDSGVPMLVTAYMPNGSLDRWLFKKLNAAASPLLSWEQRRAIAIGVACGLAYLHDESEYKIIHLDVKPANILLDSEMNPRIADFGLSRLYSEDGIKSHLTVTRVAGTPSYLAPEYAMHNQLSEKVDVYSFGIVLLELLSGRRSWDLSAPTEKIELVDWVHKEVPQAKLVDLMDKRLEGDFNKEQAKDMVTIAILCTQRRAAARPKMLAVWLMLSGAVQIPDFLATLVPQADDTSSQTELATTSSSSNF